MNLPMVGWTHVKLARFRVAYEDAKAAGQTEFLFDGNEFLTKYAAYLIEYLETRL